MTINEFIKYVQKLYGEDATYKATSKEGVTFKSKGWDDKYDSVHFDEIQLRKFARKD
jgi:hypothetical protein